MVLNIAEANDCSDENSMNAVHEIPVNSIAVDFSLLPRKQVNQHIVEDYAEAMFENAVFPPIVITSWEEHFVLIDGVHRLEAARLLGYDTVQAIVVKCNSELEIMEMALSYNMKHGQRLTKEEEIEFVKKLRQNGCTLKKIAEIVNKNFSTISRWLNEKDEKAKKIHEAIEAVEQGLTLKQAAQEFGVSESTIKRHRKKKENSESSNEANFENANLTSYTDINTDISTNKDTDIDIDIDIDIDNLIKKAEQCIDELNGILHTIKQYDVRKFKNVVSKIVNMLESTGGFVNEEV